MSNLVEALREFFGKTFEIKERYINAAEIFNPLNIEKATVRLFRLYYAKDKNGVYNGSMISIEAYFNWDHSIRELEYFYGNIISNDKFLELVEYLKDKGYNIGACITEHNRLNETLCLN